MFKISHLIIPTLSLIVSILMTSCNSNVNDINEEQQESGLDEQNRTNLKVSSDNEYDSVAIHGTGNEEGNSSKNLPYIKLIPDYYVGRNTKVSSAVMKRDIGVDNLTKVEREQRLRATVDQLKGLDSTLWDFAMNYTDNYHIGTYNYDIDFAEHSCHTLSYLIHGSKYLSKFERLKPLDKDFLKQLDIIDNVNTSKEDKEIAAFDIQLHSTSLGHYITRTSDILKMSDYERNELWNLDCVNQFSLNNEAYVQSNKNESGAFVRQRNGYADLRYTGEIDNNFYDKLEAALKKYPNIESVSIGSGGGSVGNAMSAGYLLKSKGIDVKLHSDCYSACPLVFVAGERSIMSNKPPIKLGFHQLYNIVDNEAIPAPISTYREIQNYLYNIDPTIDSNAFVNLMLSAGPNSMTYPEYEYLCSSSIAKWVQRTCSEDEYR